MLSRCVYAGRFRERFVRWQRASALHRSDALHRHFAVPVYARKLDRGESPAIIRRRLLRRSAECYLAYLVLVTSAIIGGGLPATSFGHALLMLPRVQNGNILQFFTIGLLLAWPVLCLRRRFGVWSLVWLIGLIWVTTGVLSQFTWPSRNHPAAHLLSMLIGFPTNASSAYVLQCFTFALVGMLVGRTLRSDLPRISFGRVCAIILSAAVLITLFFWINDGTRTFLNGILLRYRFLNHPCYYAWGVIEAMGLLLLTRAIIPARFAGGRRWELAVSMGQRSLLAFVLGGVLLNLFQFKASSALLAAGTCAVYLLTIWVAIAAYSLFRSRRQPPRAAGPKADAQPALNTAGAASSSR